jgi:hypothetical protein
MPIGCAASESSCSLFHVAVIRRLASSESASWMRSSIEMSHYLIFSHRDHRSPFPSDYASSSRTMRQTSFHIADLFRDFTITFRSTPLSLTTVLYFTKSRAVTLSRNNIFRVYTRVLRTWTVLVSLNFAKFLVPSGKNGAKFYFTDSIYRYSMYRSNKTNLYKNL